MINGDYFFVIVLGVVAGTRLFLLANIPSPTIKGFRTRHYMTGMVLIILSFLSNNLVIFAVGYAFIIDELPLIIARGPGHKEQYWKPGEDYWSRWCIVGVLILIFLTYVFRGVIAGLI
ncbi:MAG TPA: hypothetical protein VGO63_01770 [Candidatus Paceibacterota bacterium]|nr:hypothetical protein [Candidatus Paceibacterota bacterium]